MCYAGVAEWQTRMFKGHVRKSVGSTPTARTNEKTALIVHFQNKFEKFHFSLVFSFHDQAQFALVNGSPKNACHFLEKGANKRMVSILMQNAK